jgi:hypothetical protein
MKPSRACTASLSARVKRRLTMDLTFTSSWSWQVIRSNTTSQRQIAGRKPNAANRPEFSLSLLSSRATCLSGCPLRPCPWFLYLFYLQLMERKRLMFTYWWGVFVAVSSTCHLCGCFLYSTVLLNWELRSPAMRCDAMRRRRFLTPVWTLNVHSSLTCCKCNAPSSHHSRCHTRTNPP